MERQPHQANAYFRHQQSHQQLYGAVGQLYETVFPPLGKALFQNQIPGHPDRSQDQGHQTEPECAQIARASHFDPPEALGATVQQPRLGGNGQQQDDLPRITIVGRPNVGKSSMTNALLGEERNIVTDIAGTTRDSIHTRYNKYGMDFYLVDTAGMRKKGREMEDLEFYSVMRSIRAIENSDVCILMLDAQQGLESQDLNIHNLIVRNRKGCVIVVNKWDLVEKESNTMKEWRAFLAKKLAPFNDIPIVFASALNKQRILEVLQQAIRVYNSRRRRIPTSELNDYILPIIEAYPPASTKGKYIRIKYATQLPTPTPQFAFFVNLPQYIKEPYRRYLENKIREHWDFSGVPMQIYFRQK